MPAGESPVPGTVLVGSVASTGSSVIETSMDSTAATRDQAASGSCTGLHRPPPAIKLLQHMHPRVGPVNKKAKAQLEQIRMLGYRDFADLPITFDYYHGDVPGEASEQKRSRRWTECQNMEKWLNEQTARHNDPISNNDHNDEEIAKEAENQLVTESDTLNASLVSEVDALKVALHKSNLKCKNIMDELKKERIARIKAEENSQEIKEISIHTQALEKNNTALRTKLAEYKSRNEVLTEENKTMVNKMTEISNNMKLIEQRIEVVEQENSNLRKGLPQSNTVVTIQETLRDTQKQLAETGLERTRLREELVEIKAKTSAATVGEEGKAELLIQSLLEKMMPSIRKCIVDTISEPDRRAPSTTELLSEENTFKFPASPAPKSWAQVANRRKRTLEDPAFPSLPQQRVEFGPPNLAVFPPHPEQQRQIILTNQRKNKNKFSQRPQKSNVETQPTVPIQKATTAELLNTPNPRGATTRGTSAKILILPHEGKKVTELLRVNKILPREMGITHILQFDSGAALLTVSKEKKSELKEAIQTAGLEVKNERMITQPTWKLHNVPADYPTEEVGKDIQSATGIVPDEIVKIDYKNGSKEKTMMLIKGSLDLFNKILNRRSLQIEYGLRCRIDTEPQLMRCIKCTRMGHTQKWCTGLEKEVEEAQKADSGCLDCHSHNHLVRSGKLGSAKPRPTAHKKDSKGCPTRQHYRNKYINAVNRAGYHAVHQHIEAIEGASTSNSITINVEDNSN